MPHERFGVRIGRGQVLLSGGDQVRDTLEVPAADTLSRQFPGPPLHQVEPRRARGREVQGEPLVFLQPRLHSRLAVGPVVIYNQVQRHIPGKLTVQPPQEAQELLVPVPGHALPDHPSVQDVQGREQGSSSMPLVVMGHGPAAPFLHGQAGLGTLEGLDLALLVHTQHHSLVGRIEVRGPTPR